MSNEPMNRETLRELGFDLVSRAAGGRSQGAWFATMSDGTRVVLKWFAEKDRTAGYGNLLPKLDLLRSKGWPIPRYLYVGGFDDGTLSAQEMLPGQSKDNPSPVAVEEMLALLSIKNGVTWPSSSGGGASWGMSVVSALRSVGDDLAVQGQFRELGPRGVDVIERVLAAGDAADPGMLAGDGLVHFDLHTDNVLIFGDRITGIIDWEEARSGDPRYDLIQFAFDLDGHDQPIWHLVDTASIAPPVLRAYIALLVLKCTSSAILHYRADVPRQLDRAERLFRRFEC